MSRKRFSSVTLIKIVVFILFVIFWGLQWYYAGEVQIDPPKLIEEYTKFLGSLITVAAGFFLVNILWNRKTQEDEIRHSRNNLISFYTKINYLCKEIIKLLEQEFPIEENVKSEKRDEQIQNIMRKISVLGVGVGKNLPDLSLLEDDVLQEENVNIWSDILATIDRFPIGNDFRVNLDSFTKMIIEIQQATQNGIDALRKNTRLSWTN